MPCQQLIYPPQQFLLMYPGQCGKENSYPNEFQNLQQEICNSCVNKRKQLKGDTEFDTVVLKGAFRKNNHRIRKRKKKEKNLLLHQHFIYKFIHIHTYKEVFSLHTEQCCFITTYISHNEPVTKRYFQNVSKKSICFTCELMISIHFFNQQEWHIECSTYNFNCYLPALFHHMIILAEKEGMNRMGVGSLRHQIFIINSLGIIQILTMKLF